MKPNPNSDHRLLEAALRQDFGAFIQRSFHEVVPGAPFDPNWHIEAIAYALELVLSGKTKRLLITVPPRHLKSICASVAFPAFVLGHDPTRRIIAVSYADELAGKHALDCRRIMESAWYRSVFPNTRLSKTKNTEGEYVTTAGGYRVSTSVGGAITGRGGNLIIIDDPLKPMDALSDTKRQAGNMWFTSTLYSRLDNKLTDPIILVQQRLHMEDMVGYVSVQEDWVHLNLPAIAPEPAAIAIGPDEFYHRQQGEVLHPAREPLVLLQQLRRNLGSYQFSAQYLQEPIPVEGAIVQWRWFQRYNAPIKPQPGEMVVQSWDPAMLPGSDNDFSVCTTWLIRENRYYLLDVFRARLDYPDLKRAVYAQATKWQSREVIIEAANTGYALLAELRRAALEGIGPFQLPQIQALRPRQSKVERMAAQSAKVEAGQVFIPDQAQWLEELRKELVQFPNGRYDDQADSISQFLCRMDYGRFWWPAPRAEEPETESNSYYGRRRMREHGWPRPGICLD